jgi:ceramide glucosyltransferase
VVLRKASSMPLSHPLTTIIGLVGLALAAGYLVLACVAVLVWRTVRSGTRWPLAPPVTVLQPLCGAEAGLYENLRSLCAQDYPEFQIVYGVRDPDDPALAVVERLRREFPSRQIDLVVNPQTHGNNFKVSNLVNMFTCARYDVLTMVDSDVSAGPDYLATVTAPLANRDVGAVTCVYRDVPTARIWSRLGAMYINEWYMPSVLVARLFGFQGYASGQTICVRRDTLQAIGGLRAIANQLADDFRLGELVRGLGLRIVLSPYPLRARHDEPDASSLIRHELRWMQTIRVLRPRSFCLLFLSFGLPLPAVGIALAALEPTVATAAWALFWTAALARLVLHITQRLDDLRPVGADFWLLPAHELLLWLVWFGCFFTSRITWRGREFDVDADGSLSLLSCRSESATDGFRGRAVRGDYTRDQ